MDKKQIINAMLQIPETLKKIPTQPFYVIATGIKNSLRNSDVSNEDLRSELLIKPHLINEWLAYSEDKRVSNGWFFRHIDSITYEVGFCENRKGIIKSFIFDDAAEACAFFVNKEAEHLGFIGI